MAVAVNYIISYNIVISELYLKISYLQIFIFKTVLGKFSLYPNRVVGRGFIDAKVWRPNLTTQRTTIISNTIYHLKHSHIKYLPNFSIF